MSEIRRIIQIKLNPKLNCGILRYKGPVLDVAENAARYDQKSQTANQEVAKLKIG